MSFRRAVVFLATIGAVGIAYKSCRKKAPHPRAKDYVCTNKIDWPKSLIQRDPIATLQEADERRAKEECKHLDDFRRPICEKTVGQSWESTKCSAMRKVMSLCLNRRARIASAQNRGDILAWGAKIAERFESSKGIKINAQPEKAAYLAKLGHRLESHRKTQHYRGAFTFRTFKSDRKAFTFNAFALPGGYVYVSEDLMAMLDEAQLAVVVGHEIAHIEYASYDRALILKFQSWDGIIQKLQNIADMACSLGRGHMDEAAVDQIGLGYAISAGYDPSAGARVWTQPPLKDDRELLCYMTESHPPSWLRASNLWQAGISEELRQTWASPASYRGVPGSVELWSGEVPERVEEMCEED